MRKLLLSCIVLFIIGLIVGCSGEVATIKKDVDTSSKEIERSTVIAASQNQESTAPAAKEEPTEQVIKLGDTVILNEVKFTVNSVTGYKKIGTSMLGKETKGEFMKVCLTLENTGKTSKYLYDSMMITPKFVLSDSQGRQYDSNMEYEMYIVDKIDFMEQLQPGLPVEGCKIFEIPSNDQGLKLLISKGWLTNKALAVNIKDEEIKHLASETSLQDKTDNHMKEIMDKCNAPFMCTSSCPDMMDVGRKDCKSGQVCCMKT